MDNINKITSERFNALAQLRELDGPVASPEMIHNRLSGYVEAMRERSRDLGMTQRDADDIAYAVVALIDEVAQSKPEPLRGYWMNRPVLNLPAPLPAKKTGQGSVSWAVALSNSLAITTSVLSSRVPLPSFTESILPSM